MKKRKENENIIVEQTITQLFCFFMRKRNSSSMNDLLPQDVEFPQI